MDVREKLLDIFNGSCYSCNCQGRLAQWYERFVHTEEVTGSSPVAPIVSALLIRSFPHAIPITFSLTLTYICYRV